jgi:hypothetical protein
MTRLKRPIFSVPLLSALPVLGLLVLGTGPAQATVTPGATPQFMAIDLGTLGGPDAAPNTRAPASPKAESSWAARTPRR